MKFTLDKAITYEAAVGRMFEMLGTDKIMALASSKDPRVAMCWSGIQVEGLAENKGLVVEEPGRRFEEGYKKYLWQSYNKYSHEDTEILVEVSPKYVEIWDTSEEGYAFQLFLDFDKKTVEVKQYDKK